MNVYTRRRPTSHSDKDIAQLKRPTKIPRFDPYTLSIADFNIQSGELFNAPGWQNFSILGPRPDFLDLIDQPVPRPFSKPESERRKARGCGKGHLHPCWPRTGTISIEKCERFCWFCKLQVQTAATLRKASFALRLTLVEHIKS